MIYYFFVKFCICNFEQFEDWYFILLYVYVVFKDTFSVWYPREGRTYVNNTYICVTF